MLVQQAVERFDPEAINQQHTGYINSATAIQQSLQRFALALYLPALKDRFSREI
jgi:hypothetical protein